jgi:peptide/nickel transport system ATP-binding protein
MLQVEALSLSLLRYTGWFRRSPLPLLHDISLSLQAGEVLAVIGASGAGKSLLAQAILGLLPLQARLRGSLRFQGEALTPERQAALRGRRIALVPQSVAWLDPLARSGRQLHWAAGRAGLAAAARPGASREALRRFGLGDAVPGAFPHELSGGMARRVMLAMATIGAAELVVADEPTNGLDPVNAALVLRHLRGLADAGRGVMIVSHDLVSVLPVADRVCILRDGSSQELAEAASFRGDGAALRSPYARALWRALPDVDFAAA